MVIGVVLREAYRVATIVVRAYSRYNKYESKAFARAWKGYPGAVRKGTRHGFVVGSVVGSVIGSPMDGNDNGFSSEQKLSKTDKFDKKYSPRRGFSSFGYTNRKNYKSRCRRPLPRYNRPGKTRFYN